MAPLTTASDEHTHQALLDRLDIYAIPKPFRNPHWKPPQRRNKNVKQIITEASRKEASVMATQNNSGVSTPAVPYAAGAATPTNPVGRPPNIAQAAQSLSTLVLEKNQRSAVGLGNGSGPAATYTNIESAPSFHPSSQRRYCDVTGLGAPYTDPKTRLRYHDKEVFAVIRTMPQNVVEGHLAARGAHTVLK
jgi:INO80 complex subunit C